MASFLPVEDIPQPAHPTEEEPRSNSETVAASVLCNDDATASDYIEEPKSGMLSDADESDGGDSEYFEYESSCENYSSDSDSDDELSEYCCSPETLLDKQIAHVQRVFGADSAFALVDSRYLHDDNILLYLSFPAPQGKSLGRLWGFDEKQPIRMRMECKTNLGAESLSRETANLNMLFYQGCEPVLSGNKSATKRIRRQAQNFRLAEQLQHIAEAFLFKYWQGRDLEHTASKSVTLQATKSSQDTALQNNTLEEVPLESMQGLNLSGAASKIDPLQATKSSEDNLLQQVSMLECIACTFLNSSENSVCEICQLPLRDEIEPITSENKLSSTPTSEKSSNNEDYSIDRFLKLAFQHSDLLSQLYCYISERLPHLHRFCVNCDCTHSTFLDSVSQGRNSLIIKPSVCHRELCSWSFLDLGVGRASTDQLASTAEVVDLLLAITIAAACHDRAKMIFSPFPNYLREDKTTFLASSLHDYAKAAEIALQLPSMQQITAAEQSSQLMEICNQAGPHTYAFFNWTISSNPMHIVSLRGEHQISQMGTKYQFLMRSASPEGELAFNDAKKKHGSVFGFHGSSIENWHSILRNGLKDCSNTRLMVNGAKHGSGIYISPRAALSLMYSKCEESGFCLDSQTKQTSSASSNAFLCGRNIHIMALCEIVDTEIKRKGDIWVVQNERHVVTRFLFVFVFDSAGTSNSVSKAKACDTRDREFDTCIRETIQETWGDGEYETGI